MAPILKSFVFTIWIIFNSATLCVWNSIDEWDEINGEYTLSANTHNEYPYWQQSPTTAPASASFSCPQTTYYIFTVWWNAKLRWFIHSSLDTNSVAIHANCTIEPLPTKPTQCDLIWHNSNKELLPLIVTDGSCPKLNCGAIQLSNAGDVGCNGIFYINTADESTNNAFVSANQWYFFFNPYSFRWHCYDTYDTVHECRSDLLETNIISAANDGWTNIADGESFNMLLNNGFIATLKCISPTLLMCGDIDVGVYSGKPLTFLVYVAYESTVIFDTRAGNFIVTDIEVYSLSSNVLLQTDADHDEIVTLMNLEAGEYKIVIGGDIETVSISSLYGVEVKCISNNPTLFPSMNQATNNPIYIPTNTPTQDITVIPTLAPSALMTSSPKNVNILQCGAHINGTYNAQSLIFFIYMPFAGDLTFDASLSRFMISKIEALNELNILRATDEDHDKIITLYNIPAGEYHFIMNDGQKTGQIFDVRVFCTSKSSTLTPIKQATLGIMTKNSTHNKQIQTYSSKWMDPKSLFIIVAIVGCLCVLCALVMICVACKKHKLKKEIKQLKEIRIYSGSNILNDDSDIELTPEIDAESNESQIKSLKEWLLNQVQLPQYIPSFIGNGFDSMNIVQEMDLSHLINIGIETKAHQTLILLHISKICDVDPDVTPHDIYATDVKHNKMEEEHVYMIKQMSIASIQAEELYNKSPSEINITLDEAPEESDSVPNVTKYI